MDYFLISKKISELLFQITFSVTVVSHLLIGSSAVPMLRDIGSKDVIAVLE